MTVCPRCSDTGRIPRGTNAWGDRLSEICSCAAGAEGRRYCAADKFALHEADRLAEERESREGR